jgi:hypothetical protein
VEATARKKKVIHKSLGTEPLIVQRVAAYSQRNYEILQWFKIPNT